MKKDICSLTDEKADECLRQNVSPQERETNIVKRLYLAAKIIHEMVSKIKKRKKIKEEGFCEITNSLRSAEKNDREKSSFPVRHVDG